MWIRFIKLLTALAAPNIPCWLLVEVCAVILVTNNYDCIDFSNHPNNQKGPLIGVFLTDIDS